MTKRQIEIWVQGAEWKDAEIKATHLGTVLATNFRQACDDLLGKSDSYHDTNATYWGYRLFDNEKEAREFGR